MFVVVSLSIQFRLVIVNRYCLLGLAYAPATPMIMFYSVIGLERGVTARPHRTENILAFLELFLRIIIIPITSVCFKRVPVTLCILRLHSSSLNVLGARSVYYEM